MIGNEDRLRSVAGLLAAASLEGDWAAALDGVADACGAWASELIGMDVEPATRRFYRTTRTDPAAQDEFVQLGLYEPAVNPRVRKGRGARVGETWHDVACSTDDELRRNFAHADFCRRHGIGFGSQATLLHTDQLLVGLTVLRDDGPPAADERRAFEALVPVVTSAVRTQLALERQGARLVEGSMQAMGLAAFVCDGGGRVCALTPLAEAAVSRGPLRLAAGRLAARRPDDGEALQQAMRRALAAQGPFSQAVVLHGAAAMDLEIADVATLPRRPFAFGFEPRVLVTLRGTRRRDADLPRLLIAAYGLTPAEADLAVALAAGEGREAFADRRGVTIATVRGHLKRIFAKLDIHREGELSSRLQRFR